MLFLLFFAVFCRFLPPPFDAIRRRVSTAGKHTLLDQAEEPTRGIMSALVKPSRVLFRRSFNSSLEPAPPCLHEHIAANPTFFPSITCLFLAIGSSHTVPLLSPTWTLAIPTDLVSFHCNSTVRIAAHRTRLLRTQQSSTAPCTLLSRGKHNFHSSRYARSSRSYCRFDQQLLIRLT